MRLHAGDTHRRAIPGRSVEPGSPRRTPRSRCRGVRRRQLAKPGQTVPGRDGLTTSLPSGQPVRNASPVCRSGCRISQEEVRHDHQLSLRRERFGGHSAPPGPERADRHRAMRGSWSYRLGCVAASALQEQPISGSTSTASKPNMRRPFGATSSERSAAIRASPRPESGRPESARRRWTASTTGPPSPPVDPTRAASPGCGRSPARPTLTRPAGADPRVWRDHAALKTLSEKADLARLSVPLVQALGQGADAGGTRHCDGSAPTSIRGRAG